jgi:hypothetical protein
MDIFFCFKSRPETDCELGLCSSSLNTLSLC